MALEEHLAALEKTQTPAFGRVADGERATHRVKRAGHALRVVAHETK